MLLSKMNKRLYIKKIFKISRDFSSDKISIVGITELIRSADIVFPKYLYKYRFCNDDNFSALSNKKCYFSLPSLWNDSIDSTISFDFEKDLKKLENSKTAVPLTAYRIIENYLKNNNLNNVISFEDFQKVYSSLFPNGGVDWSKEHSFTNFTRNVIGINGIYKAVKNAFESLLSTNEVRNQHLMLSLSNTHKNNMMWEKYSNNDSGFCIKYNIKKLIRNNPLLVLSILPIYYGNKKSISFLEYLNIAFDPKNTEEAIYNISQQLYISMLTKNIEWAGEQEWRFICEDRDIDNKLRMFDCAEAIFLGSKINIDDKSKLMAISKNNNLKVFQRKLVNCKNKYEYQRIL